MALKALLTGSTLREEFSASTPLVYFHHNQTVGRVLEVLSAHRITSAPVVVTPDTRGDDRAAAVKAILGFVSVGDVLECFLQGLAQQAAASITSALLEAVGLELCERAVITIFGGRDVSASPMDVMSSTDSGKDWTLKGNLSTSLLDIIRHGFLAAGPEAPVPLQPAGHSQPHHAPHKAIHRLAVFDSSSAADAAGPVLLGVYSQSDAIRFLHQHPDSLGPLRRKTVQELHLAHSTALSSPHGPGQLCRHRGRGLVCVRENITTLEAFRRMHSEHVSGAGVLSEDGERLIGNVSVSDLRCLGPGRFGALLLPLRQFLLQRPLLVQAQQGASQASHQAPPLTALLPSSSGAHHSSSPTGMLHTGLPNAVTCQATSSLADIIALCCQHRVHRVYIVDPDQQPSGVVTLTDILQVVSAACG